MKVKVREKSGVLDIYSGYYLRFDAYVINNKVVVTYDDPEKYSHVGLGTTTKTFPTWGKANAFLMRINAVMAGEETPNMDEYRKAYIAYSRTHLSKRIRYQKILRGYWQYYY